jgi:hypothetical protein
MLKDFFVCDRLFVVRFFQKRDIQKNTCQNKTYIIFVKNIKNWIQLKMRLQLLNQF